MSSTAPRGVRTPPFSRQTCLQFAPSGRYSDHYLDITFTNTAATAQDFVERHLSTCTALGFDLEHRPTFRVGQKPNVALLQFAPAVPASETHHPVLLYSIFHDAGRIPSSLVDLLRDERVKKYGVGIHGDLKHLAFLRLTEAKRRSYVELGPLAFEAGAVERKTVGLKALVASLLGPECALYKTKRLTMTNWELSDLSPAQQMYAAMDAVAAIESFQMLRYQPPKRPETTQRHEYAISARVL